MNYAMPELSSFLGIILTMRKTTLRPCTSMATVEELCLLHEEELLGDWALAQNRQPLIRIEPLE